MRFLQIGKKSWEELLELNEGDEWFFLPDTLTTLAELEAETQDMREIQYEEEEQEEQEKEEADDEKTLRKQKRPTHLTIEQFIGSLSAIIIENTKALTVVNNVKEYIQPYSVFYDEQISEPELPEWHRLYGFFPVALSDPTELYDRLTRSLFNGQYGDKMSIAEFRIQPTLKGTVTRESLSHVTISGDFGDDAFRPIGSWCFNRVNFAGLNLEIWLEHQATDGVELQLRVRQMQEGSIDQIISNVVYSQAELQEAIVLEDTNNGQVIVTLEARGKGEMKIGILHVRWSRMGFGKFLIGGGIVSDAAMDEINYYFHPGDMKPPLCVYFSGFRSAEGFEGYWMMKSLKTPFLLISDQRLLGGAFYMGSDELEDKVRGVIQDKLDLLGFSNQDLIFSGLSMGTYGSLYYAADFNPRAVIIGKPLANLGKMAVLNKTFSPSSFAASLYILRKYTHGLSESHVQALQDRFWNKFVTGNYKDTTFGIIYLKEDDYDGSAYFDIVNSLYESKTQIIGKGFSGRHLDNTDAVVHWFLTYYRHIFERDFGRK